MIRNSEVVYPVSGFVHVILEFSLWVTQRNARYTRGKKIS